MDVHDCAETTKSYSLSYKPSENTVVDVDDNFFVGIDISGHIGIGGHLKLGFNIPWSW